MKNLKKTRNVFWKLEKKSRIQKVSGISILEGVSKSTHGKFSKSTHRKISEGILGKKMGENLYKNFYRITWTKCVKNPWKIFYRNTWWNFWNNFQDEFCSNPWKTFWFFSGKMSVEISGENSEGVPEGFSIKTPKRTIL